MPAVKLGVLCMRPVNSHADVALATEPECLVFRGVSPTKAKEDFVHRCISSVQGGVGAISVLCFSSIALAQLPPIPQGDIQIQLDIVASFDPSFSGSNLELTPIDLIPFNDGTGRLMLSTLGGTIRVLRPDGAGGFDLLNDPLLNSTQTGLQLQQESGMTGIALHPDFARTGAFGFGKLYTITTENGVNNGGLGGSRVDFPFDNEIHQDVIREWNINTIVGNANVNMASADITTADSREILRVDQIGPFHNLFDLAFDNNKNLIIGSGDGGLGQGDNPVSSRDRRNIYGNILRINPDVSLANTAGGDVIRTSANTGQPAYFVPASNPFNGDDVNETRNRHIGGVPQEPSASTLAEIIAYGVRSPYRVTVDPVTGDIYWGDVGAGQREEVNRVVAGGDFGWGEREGNVDGPLPEDGSNVGIAPLFEYDRDEGRTVVGGFVYRGSAIPELRGKYVFAEFGQLLDSARLFYGIVDGNDPDVPAGFAAVGDFFEFDLSLSQAEFPIDVNRDFIPDRFDSPLPDRLFSIGVDEFGELFLVAGQDPRGGAPSVPGAFIVRIIPEPASGFTVCGLVATLLLQRRRRCYSDSTRSI